MRATRVAATDGVEVALHELGGDGPPLLLCHATGFCARAYEPLAAILGRRFRVIGVDLRGHGHSTAPDDPASYGWDRIVNDVVAAVDALELRGAAAFGHSIGGAMVLHAAAARPGAIGAAYVYEPILFPPGFKHLGEHPMIARTTGRRDTFPSRAEALERYASRPPFGLVRADCLHAYVTHGFEDLPCGGVRLRCLPSNEAAVYAGELWSTTDRITSVTAPVLVAAGGVLLASGLGQLGSGVVESLPQGRAVRYPHLGHFGPLEDPRTVCADALAFLTGEAAV
jgi:pimeloyl-ACP methyl ester carboxylesterase